jgi:hypothetical protein
VAGTKYDLSSVRLKLDRAKYHIEAFGQDLQAFLDHDPAPFGFRTEKNRSTSDTVEYVLYAIVREPPPRELALVIGDAIQNMRVALEYLAYELSTPKARKSGNTAFPIYKDATKFDPSGIRSVTGDERTLIERVQPYAATKIPANDPLAILQKLSNRDKHRLLIPMIAAVDDGESWVASSNADVRFRYLHRGPVADGARIVSFTATPQDPALSMDVQPHSGLEVQIQDTGIVGFDVQALGLLQMIEHHIRWQILNMWFDHGWMPRTWSEIESVE